VIGRKCNDAETSSGQSGIVGSFSRRAMIEGLPSEWTAQDVKPRIEDIMQLTFVPPQPNLNANSCARSSPKPSIMPLTKGKSRFIAAPRSIDHTVGGWYMTTGEPSPLLFDDRGGEVEGGESDE
jgi:hypothetical protein